MKVQNPYLFLLSLVTLFIFSCSEGPGVSYQAIDIDTSGRNVNLSKNTSQGVYKQGEAIFKKDCNSCHVAKNKLRNYLEGVVDPVGPSYLNLYLTRQDSLIKAKDSNALMVKGVWGNQPNSHNFKYTDAALNAIIEYLK